MASFTNKIKGIERVATVPRAALAKLTSSTQIVEVPKTAVGTQLLATIPQTPQVGQGAASPITPLSSSFAGMTLISAASVAGNPTVVHSAQFSGARNLVITCAYQPVGIDLGCPFSRDGGVFEPRRVLGMVRWSSSGVAKEMYFDWAEGTSFGIVADTVFVYAWSEVSLPVAAGAAWPGAYVSAQIAEGTTDRCATFTRESDVLLDPAGVSTQWFAIPPFARRYRVYTTTAAWNFSAQLASAAQDGRVKAPVFATRFPTPYLSIHPGAIYIGIYAQRGTADPTVEFEVRP